jgi:hypothetical protein
LFYCTHDSIFFFLDWAQVPSYPGGFSCSAFQWRHPFSLLLEHSAQATIHHCPSHAALKLSACTSVPLKDHGPGLYSPSVRHAVSTQEMFTEQQWILKWQPDYRMEECFIWSYKIHCFKFTNCLWSAIFPNDIKGMQS